MSLASTTFRDWWNDTGRPSRLLDQHFGLGLTPDELLRVMPMPPLTPPFRDYLRPWGDLLEQNNTISKVQGDKDKFQVVLDVQQFTPDELTVKTIENFIIVEGKHEEKKDEQGYTSRHFIRRYVLPEAHDIDKVASNLSSDGVLTVEASLKIAPADPGEKSIRIEKAKVPA